ncbi:MAG: YopX family protein [Oscillospiraceae bacterium]
MREILFRGKRVDNGEWYEGADVMHKTIRGELCLANIGEDWVSVDPSTFSQYTGLTDRNGVRIFEGDIVTGWFNHEKIVGYIFYGGNSQFFIQRDGLYGIGLDNANNWLEVISNIHDNPELLEGGEGE